MAQQGPPRSYYQLTPEQLEEARQQLIREKDDFEREKRQLQESFSQELAQERRTLRETLDREREIMMVDLRVQSTKKATIGELKSYVHGKGDSWNLYKERMMFYFKVNQITDNKIMLDILLTLMGTESYRLLRNALYPILPQDSDWDTVMEKLNTIFQPTKHYLVERAKFLKRVQQQNESTIEFMNELRGLSEHCEFDNLDEALCSQTITGIRDEELKTRILQTDDGKKLTFSAIQKIASAYESAKRNAHSLNSGIHQSNVFSMGNQPAVNQRQFHARAPFMKKGVSSQQQHPQKKQQEVQKPTNKVCYRCGKDHPNQECKYISTVCYYCKKIGHLQSMCNQLKKQQYNNSKFHKKGNTHYVEDTEPSTSSQLNNESTKTGNPDISYLFNSFTRDSLYQLSHKDDKYSPPIILPVLINEKMLHMEVDSGAASSIIGYDTYRKCWPEGLPLHPIDRNLHTWSKELLLIKGCAIVNVEFKGKVHQLPLLVMFKSGPCILGRNWFRQLNINITQDKVEMCANLSEKKESSVSVPQEIQEFSHMFSPGLGKYTGPPVSIELKEGAKPVFRPARQVPYARVAAAEQRIEELVKDGYMSPVKFSEFATPVLFVTCSDGTLRMVGDYSGTVNPICKVDIYPMPTVNHVLDNLAGAKYFTKLDLKRAFNQITVDEKTANILTLNTSKGLFKVHRLSPGLTVAPAIFQRTIAGVLNGAPGVISYIDDVLIQGKTKEELWERTREVLRRLDSFGLKLNLSKCIFCVESLDFIGYKIAGDGVKPTEEKVESLLAMPSPTDKPELQSFLGYVNYYDRFLENKATRFHPLYKLLHEDTPWHWGQQQQKAVEYVKRVMSSDVVLTPYNTELPIILSVDASPVGIGYVISHIMPDGIEKPVAFGSRTLRPAEKNYSQLDKEALAIIFGIKKFNQYLAGRKFTIYTDHKPLLGIFKPGKPIPETLSPRLTRWCLFMSGYLYQLVYRPGKLNGNADCLSRLPVPAEPQDESTEDKGVLLLEIAPENSVLTASNIAKLTLKDPVLSKVLHILLHGGDVKQMPEEYRRNSSAYSVSKGCVLYSDRVVIPTCLQQKLLLELHKHHIGIERMKQLARSYIYWPNIDQDIVKVAQSRVTCAIVAKDPPKVPTTPWLIPQAPWSRIHIDFAGPYKGRVFLIIIDAYSKWIEVFDTKNSQTSYTVIKILRNLFATHGICDQICSDNGPAFRSEEFKQFCDNNLIKHVTIADYKAATNGQAERTVQTVKNYLSKVETSEWEKELPKILLNLRSVPSPSTGKSPAELLFGRKLRTMWDKLHPLYTREAHLKREEEVRKKSEATSRNFEVDDLVWFRIYNKPQRWQAGVIIEAEGHRNFKIISENNQMFRRHLDQLRKRIVTTPPETRANINFELQDSDVPQEEPESDSSPLLLNDKFFSNQYQFSKRFSSVTDPVDSTTLTGQPYASLSADHILDNSTTTSVVQPQTSTPKSGLRKPLVIPEELTVTLPVNQTPVNLHKKVTPLKDNITLNESMQISSPSVNSKTLCKPRVTRERRIPTYLKDYVLK